MIEILMENHLVSDNNCNVVNLCCPIFGQGMTSNVSLGVGVGVVIRCW